MAWTINGQTLRDGGYQSAVLSRRNLGSNDLSFSQIANSPSDPAIVLGKGDAVTAALNGVVQFRGKVVEKRKNVRESGVEFTFKASGLWFDLSKRQLSGAQIDQTGAIAQRLQFTVPEQDVAASLSSLVAQFNSLGVPCQLGGTVATNALPQLTFSNTSCADALVDLMRWVADGILWVDDASTPPTIHMTRRNDAIPESFTFGEPPLQSYDLTDLAATAPDGVALNYIEREVDGRAKFAVQESKPNPEQAVTISGGENADFLPLDLFDSADVRTVPRTSGADEIVCERSSSLQQFASCPGLGIAGTVNFSNTQGGGSGASFFTRSFPAPVYALEDGSAAPASHGFALLSGSAPSFAHPADFLLAELTGFFIASIRERSASQGGGFPDWPQWADETPGFDQFSGYRQVNQSFTEDLLTIWRVWQFSAPTAVSRQEFSTLTTIYKEADYAFIQPPDGLAAYLEQCQNYPNVQGSFQIEPQEALPRIAPVSILNDSEIIRAMPTEVVSQLNDATHSIEIGAPYAVRYYDLANRFRQSPQDNIVYL